MHPYIGFLNMARVPTSISKANLWGILEHFISSKSTFLLNKLHNLKYHPYP